jgi:hypothetical protein
MIDERLAKIHAAGTLIVIATHQQDEWPSFATHELELANGIAVYAGAVRSSVAVRSAATVRPAGRVHGKAP